MESESYSTILSKWAAQPATRVFIAVLCGIIAAIISIDLTVAALRMIDAPDWLLNLAVLALVPSVSISVAVATYRFLGTQSDKGSAG